MKMMPKPIICPTITAFNLEEFASQVEAVSPFATRLHIDLMDGDFAPSESPDLESITLPTDMDCDIHLMYERPEESLRSLIRLRPKLVIFHYEADVDHEAFARELKRHGIRAGLALLQTTPYDLASNLIEFFDHVLIFSGNLGYHGGQAQLSLLNKAKEVKQNFPDAELAWDGGINDENIVEIAEAGINVLNVGGYIQSASDPGQAYVKIEKLI
jgi:ribulose-phosphate 3-epimerase